MTGGKKLSTLSGISLQASAATNVSSFYYDRELAGQFWIAADLANGVSLEELENAIDETLTEFIKKGPNSKNLKNTKTTIRSSFIKGLQRIEVLAGNQIFLHT